MLKQTMGRRPGITNELIKLLSLLSSGCGSLEACNNLSNMLRTQALVYKSHYTALLRRICRTTANSSRR